MKQTIRRAALSVMAIIVSLGGVAQSKRHVVGTINVETATQGTLYIDGKPARKMSVYHQVVITGLNPGPHSLAFQSGDSVVQREILVTPGKTDHYIIRMDTALLDSTSAGRVSVASKMSVHSYYIPKAKGLYALVKVGFSSASGGDKSPINGQAIAGYQFSPKFSAGGGVGYAKNYGKFSYHTDWDWGTESWNRITSSEFPVSFVTVFLDIRLNANKKKVVPYLAFDIGCSFPVTQTVDGTWGYNFDYGFPFHVNKINPGLYFGINPGLKVYLYSKYYLDLSMGGDICVNNYKGDLPDDYSQRVKSISNFHMTVGFGF